MKTCTRCNIVKPATTEFFHIHTVRGLQSQCKACRNDLARAKHRRSPGCQYDSQLLNKYGLTRATHDHMRALQGNGCGICKRAFEATPQVDHNHETGKVRGLLCGPCNRALGLFQDSQATLMAALVYLENHS